MSDSPDRSAAVARAQHERIAEFFTYPCWNKHIEYAGDREIFLSVTRHRDRARHVLHSNTVHGVLGPVDMLVLMAAMALDHMRACDADICQKHPGQRGNDGPG